MISIFLLNSSQVTLVVSTPSFGNCLKYSICLQRSQTPSPISLFSLIQPRFLTSLSPSLLKCFLCSSQLSSPLHPSLPLCHIPLFFPRSSLAAHCGSSKRCSVYVCVSVCVSVFRAAGCRRLCGGSNEHLETTNHDHINKNTSALRQRRSAWEEERMKERECVCACMGEAKKEEKGEEG